MGLQHALLLLALACPALLPGSRAAERPPGLQRAKKAELPNWRPADLRLDRLRLPPGFAAELYTDESLFLPARFLALGRANANATVVYASTSEEGVVFAVVDRLDGRPREACVLLQGLNQPNGVAYDPATGSLYVAAVRWLGGRGAGRCMRAGRRGAAQRWRAECGTRHGR